MKKIFAVLMLIGSLGVLSTVTGCNTVAGAGKDVERAGEKVQDTAHSTQQKM